MSKPTTSRAKRKRKNSEPELETKKVKLSTSKTNTDNAPNWDEYELLSEQTSINLNVVKETVHLFENGDTIPFIARYRRNVTNNMTADELRLFKENYEQVVTLKNKIGSVLKKLETEKVLTEPIRKSLVACKTLNELEYIREPFKQKKRTLAEKARELGLGEPAMNILHNKCAVNLTSYIKKPELNNIADIEKGIVDIISSVFAVDPDILKRLRELKNCTHIMLKTKKINKREGIEKKTKESQESQESKFTNYFDFQISVKHIKPHQVLAINRAEHLKIIKVTIEILPQFYDKYLKLTLDKWLSMGPNNHLREHLLRKASEESYSRLVEPLIQREVRSELKQKAENASYEVFSMNLKSLLLSAPVKGKTILGVDPGYVHGCKLAMISPQGTLLDSQVIFPNRRNNDGVEREAVALRELLVKHGCETIALGNATASRQTEEWLSSLIHTNFFHPLNVQYTIIREDGASIYSCSAEAKKEFPSLDPNIISAVSLARRVQDPLSEYIKVEPKHLGIGMYQHDVKKTQLGEALNDVISECVSFVGIDLNTASQFLLKHIAGLSEKRAQQIVDHRTKNGAFQCRNELLDVFGIGKKVYIQCAGFLRIKPSSVNEAKSFYKNPKTVKFDNTNIHPESYNLTTKLIKKLKLKKDDLGEPHFISTIISNNLMSQLKTLAEEFSSDEHTLRLIVDCLSKPLSYDCADCFHNQPIFKKGMLDIADLSVGGILTGVVGNVTHFGCFVDVGVGTDGLIHISKYGGLHPQIGDKLEVKVLSVEIGKKRIGLQALRILD